MRLEAVYIRFYKSFNYDYLRKHRGSSKAPWEMIDNQWYPFVRVLVDPKVTTVVGANESGKSHLLSAIEVCLGRTELSRADLCRYSRFATVEQGKVRWPDLACSWGNLTDDDKKELRDVFGLKKRDDFDRFTLLRQDKASLSGHFEITGEARHFELKDKAKAEALVKTLPRIFRIDARIALPDSVPILSLLQEGGMGAEGHSLGRRDRLSLEEYAFKNPQAFASGDQIRAHADGIAAIFKNDTATTGGRSAGELSLARNLLFKVARVDPSSLTDLRNALRNGNEGYAKGIVQQINQRLSESLNFPTWWAQDSEFRLLVDAQGSDIVFTIQDRTGTFYSFDERSSGLKYFLSYYIQYLSHRAEHTSGEIILMDEPDAYLSSQGQQDLLKILESFTTAESGHAQVIYVTHSPFLIDKNKIDRVRVLEKGSGDEGTRVVRDISRNHFEPLRSAFGAFVAETTFIGNTNIMVEGMADQILLAGMALHLHRRGALRNDTIDLNRTTIVPVSSASSVPYMVYLARGRDVEQPAVVVLLDSDDAGNEARAVLRKGPPRGKQLLNDKYVLQVGDLKGVSASTEQVIVETEDLIPAGVCLTAIVRYLKEVCGAPDSLVEDLRQEDLAQMIKEKGRAFDGVEAFVDTISKSEFHIEKVGFARTVIDVIQADRVDGVEVLEENFRVLFQQLNHVIREAERERSHVSVGRRIDRMKHSFIQDHPAMARCEDVQMLLEDMEATLQDDRESDEMKILINKLRRDFAIDASPGAGIADYASFRSRLDSISYAGKIATQEEDVIESVAPVAGHATLGQVEPLLQTPLQSKTETSREMSSVDDNVQ